MKRILFFTLAALLSTLSASAYDFKVDGIAYQTINGGKSVAVCKGGDYTGDITIPENVTYKGATYSVTEIGDRVFFVPTKRIIPLFPLWEKQKFRFYDAI